jgi:S-adenosylmethionine uptake transporter
VVFLRFLFSTITLLPFLFIQGKSAFYTPYIKVHILRGGVLFAAILIWCISLNTVQIIVATLFSFTVPLFFIVLAYFFLQEKIGWQRAAVTVTGFIGSIVVLNPTSIYFDPRSLLLAVAALLFASLDVINKKFVTKETTVNMMFFSSLVTSILSLLPAVHHWVWPNAEEVLLCFLLGCGANIILLALLRSFALADATSLGPFRYLELIFATAFGYIFFREIPGISVLLGAAIIIPSTLALVYFETRKANL